jgi:nitroreductase
MKMNNQILKLIDNRRTTALFDQTKKLDEEQIKELIRLATKAPTSFNLQNWRFIAVMGDEAKLKLRKISWDQAKITEAAVTFIICGQMADEKTLPQRLRPAVDAKIMPENMIEGWVAGAGSLYLNQSWRQRDEAVRSALLGAMTLMLAAEGMGLGAGPMIGFDRDAVSIEFGLKKK